VLEKKDGQKKQGGGQINKVLDQTRWWVKKRGQVVKKSGWEQYKKQG
jgi:hypothetical protein